MEFGYVMKHLHKIKPTFISIFSLSTDLFEMLYQTLGRVFDIYVATCIDCCHKDGSGHENEAGRLQYESVL